LTNNETLKSEPNRLENKKPSCR